MGMLTVDMKRVIGEQRLGFFATVCEDGSPNVSPKGTTYVLDDDHLLFAEIRSPQTVANMWRTLAKLGPRGRTKERVIATGPASSIVSIADEVADGP